MVVTSMTEFIEWEADAEAQEESNVRADVWV